jgi:signal transduction histidine kinase
LCLDGATLQLIVTDDGLGLPDRSEPGLGLASMRERAAELGGRCVIGSAPGGGTLVTAILPCAAPAEGA